jgi:hypothetical protein
MDRARHREALMKSAGKRQTDERIKRISKTWGI